MGTADQMDEEAEDDSDMRNWAAICSALGWNYSTSTHLTAELRAYIGQTFPVADDRT